MLKPGDIAIVSGARTPFGRYCGKIKDYTAQELGAVAAKAAIERAGVDPRTIRSRCLRQRAADFRRRALWRAACRVCARDCRLRLRRLP